MLMQSLACVAALFIWFLALAFPFYGNINSIIGKPLNRSDLSAPISALQASIVPRTTLQVALTLQPIEVLSTYGGNLIHSHSVVTVDVEHSLTVL